MTSSLTHLVPLAKELDESKVTPGVLGFVVFAVIGLAVWLLMKNMNKQFTKINFEERGDSADQAPDGERATQGTSTDGGGAARGTGPRNGPASA